MKLKENIVRLATAAVVSLAAVSPVHALVFTDPVNLVQNTLGARAGIQNEINSARALIQQINAAKDLARSTKALTNLDKLAGVAEAAKLYRQLMDIDRRLDANLDRNTQLIQDMRAQVGASNQSWDSYMSSRSQFDSQQRQLQRDRYAAVASSMEETTRRRQEIVSQLSQVQGQTEAMQSLGAALDVIIGQNQQIISALTATEKIKDNSRDLDAADEEKASARLDAYQQRLREAANKF